MAEFFTVITDAGREAVARATQAGEKVNITHFAVGDGGGSAVTPDESQTQLVNECWRGLVATYSQQGDSLIIDTYIPPDEGNFTIREMGVFTADGVLFAVCNTPAMPKVLPIKGAVDSFVFGMKLDVTNIDMSYIEIHTNPMLDFIKNSEKGQPNGVAELDEHGNLKQLPELNFDPAGSAATVQGNLNAHINNKQNPHGVTAAQVGAYDKNQSLTSVTAGLFGLSASAVPNDVLVKIKTLIDSVNTSIPKIKVSTGAFSITFGSRKEINLDFNPDLVIIQTDRHYKEDQISVDNNNRSYYSEIPKILTKAYVYTDGSYITNSGFSFIGNCYNYGAGQSGEQYQRYLAIAFR